MEASEFISIEQIYSDLVTACNDEGFIRSGLDKGFYISRIHDAVTFFALETLYQTVVKDIVNFHTQYPDGVIPIPVNAFNMREIYLFSNYEKTDVSVVPIDGQTIVTVNGTEKMSNFAIVHWKRTLATGKSGLKTMRIKSPNTDPVLSGNDFFSMSPNKDYPITNGLYYGNIQSGNLILSDNHTDFKSIRLIYNGMGSENGEIPCIPRILKDGIFMKAYLDSTFYLKTRMPEYRTHYADAYGAFHGQGRNKGVFAECKSRIALMDKFKRDSMKEYFSNADHI